MNDVKDVKMVNNTVNDVKMKMVKVIQTVKGELIWEMFFSQLLYAVTDRCTCIVDW